MRPKASEDDKIAIKKMAADPAFKTAGWHARWIIVDNYFVYDYTVDAQGNTQYRYYDWNHGACNWNQFAINTSGSSS